MEGGRTQRQWEFKTPDPSLVREIRSETGLSHTCARILANRGVVDPGGAGRFLHGTLRDLSPPFLMRDLEKAARRLIEAGARNEPVLIYADYDVDGATGAACLFLFLKEIFPGLPVRIHQNHRVADGYGMRVDRLESAAASGVRLVVTVDCGISDVEAIRKAGELGMDVIVTDHHLPGRALPPAAAILNPRRSDCRFPEKELAGVGVVFMLVRGILRLALGIGPAEGNVEPGVEKYLDLVAMGTVADMVPLRGDNRILVKEGLGQMRRNPRAGVSALLSISGIPPEDASESDLGFRIGPRLNAAGRMGDSRRSSDILITGDRLDAMRLAAELSQENSRRQREEERILRSAEAALRSGPPVTGLGAIVLADPDWHLGVLGIVASKLAERFFRPTVLLRTDGNEARGSSRSVGGFPIVDALGELSPLLSRYGGHSQAAGLALPLENIPAFREGLNRIASEYAARGCAVPTAPVDATVRLGEISGGLMDEFDRIRPFGMGNEEPVLLAEGLRVTRKNQFGLGSRHLKFEVEDADRKFEVVAFHRSSLPMKASERLDLLFTPQRVHFRGTRSVRLLLRDARPHTG